MFQVLFSLPCFI